MRPLILVAALALASCSGSDGDRTAVPESAPTPNEAPTIDPAPSIASPTSAPAGTPTPVPSSTERSTASPSTAPAPRSSSTALPTITSTTIPTTTTVSVATTTAVRCDGTDGRITTPSGRAIVLRTAGITAPAPTVLVLHGYTGTPSGIERVADLTAEANGAGVAVAYPEGTPVAAGGFGWNTGADVFATTGIDDVAALVEMIDAIISTGCVDPDRLTITGESNGAGMTLAALCAPGLRDAFRSAVMVIPAIDGGVLDRCEGFGAPDVPLTAVVGLIDRTAPFDGGNGLLSQRAWFDTVSGWRGCSAVVDAGMLTPAVARVAGSDCRACTELLAVSDGPHTWPGTTQGTAGLAPGTFDLNRRIVADVLALEAGCLSDR